MKKEFKLSLEFQGIVIFAPVVLVNFLNANNVEESNVFERFINDEKLGEKAISEGILFPIYTIPELNYDIIIDTDNNYKNLAGLTKVFTYEKYGLRVESSTLIFSDIFTIMDWTDADFFLNHRENYADKSDTNDYYELSDGNYLVSITGFRDEDPHGKKGYEIILKKVDSLPDFSSTEDIDMIDYDVTA